jgi:hypothetical protein
MLGALLKNTSPPVGTENCSKLWNKLFSAVVPLVISLMLPSLVTVELVVVSGTICAWIALGNETAKQLLGTRKNSNSRFIKRNWKFFVLYSLEYPFNIIILH